jgi:nicotinamidase-related amidase
MKNGFKNLKLAAVALLITGAYWLSYGMSPTTEYRVSTALNNAVKEAVAAADAECKSGAGACKSPETILRESREAGAIAAETVQAQLNQEAIARGQKPTVSRTGAKQPVVSAVGGAAVTLPNLKGPRKFAALIIDDQYDFMELSFQENALGGSKLEPKGRLAVGQADQAMLDDTVQFLSGWKRDKVFSQDWHPAGHVSHNTSFENREDGKPAPLYAPLGEAAAKKYKAVGAPGVPRGCVGVDEIEADMTGKVAVNPTQVMWPVHCVQGTVGAEIPDALFKNGYASIKNAAKKIADGLYGDPATREYIVEKGYHCSVDSYSAFLDVDKKTQTALFKFAAQQGITDIAIMGIANDYCVGSSAEDAINGGLNVHYIGNLSRGVDTAGMVKKFQHLSKLRGPNGARLVFYDLTDINDKGYSKNLLTKAGLWPITEKMTTAQFYALVDAIEGGKPAVAPTKPAVPVAAPTPAPVAGEEEEDIPALIDMPAPPTAAQQDTLAAKYNIQKRQTVSVAPDLKSGTITSAVGSYIRAKIGGKGAIFQVQPDGGYRIEFKNNIFEYDANKKLIELAAPVAPASSSSSSSSAHVKPEPTFAERYETQKAQFASAWKSADFKRGLDMDTLTEAGEYGSIAVAAGGPAPFVYKKTRSALGDQWMIEFKDMEYTYGQDGAFVSQRLLGPGMPASTPAVTPAPASMSELLAIDPFASMPAAATSSDIPSDVSSF